MNAYPAAAFSGHRFDQAQQVRTARDIEYDAFSRVTRALQAAQTGAGSLAAAAQMNLQLWSVLAADLAEEDNGLPADLRGSLLSLAIFSIRHSRRVMAGDADAAAAIHINLHVMKGLRGEVAV